MKLVNELLDYTTELDIGSNNVRLFTGNPVITKAGRVVMGRGTARVVRDFYTDIDKFFADMIRDFPDDHVHILETPNGQWIGWFKVKHHWRDNADLTLVANSVKELTAHANNNPDIRFHLNYPAIGNGKLDVSQVEPLLQNLPDNVYVYK